MVFELEKIDREFSKYSRMNLILSRERGNLPDKAVSILRKGQEELNREEIEYLLSNSYLFSPVTFLYFMPSIARLLMEVNLDHMTEKDLLFSILLRLKERLSVEEYSSLSFAVNRAIDRLDLAIPANLSFILFWTGDVDYFLKLVKEIISDSFLSKVFADIFASPEDGLDNLWSELLFLEDMERPFLGTSLEEKVRNGLRELFFSKDY